MNKVITTALITGAAVAGVAGVLTLSPDPTSLGALPGTGSLGGAASTDTGTESGSGLRTSRTSAYDEHDDDDTYEDDDDQLSAPTTSSAGTPTSGAAGTSYAGSTYSSPYGPMQVSITVSGGKITDIRWEQVPQSDGHSYRINSYAAPLLVDQALQAQSATVDGVSGATYTTEGFRTSLQSAIEKAGL